MTQLEIDQQYIKSITSLHTSETFIRQEPLIIQLALEEAIRTKTGKSVDFTSLIAPSIKQKADELKNIANAAALALIEETKTASSSDNELELDLLKEDLMCIICKYVLFLNLLCIRIKFNNYIFRAMDVGARNRLLECVGCHSLYHQECHRPIVSQEDADQDWLCQSCKVGYCILIHQIYHCQSNYVHGTYTVPDILTLSF